MHSSPANGGSPAPPTQKLRSLRRDGLRASFGAPLTEAYSSRFLSALVRRTYLPGHCPCRFRINISLDFILRKYVHRLSYSINPALSRKGDEKIFPARRGNLGQFDHRPLPLRQHIPGENCVKTLTKYWTFEQSTIIILWKNFSQ